ncbi:hypothetical protein K491DRAFT_553090, partial [Lophiostoma macrostomum CBS 122681]
SVVFVSLASACTLLATVSVAIRFVSRLRMSKSWWDDWTILAALVLAYGYLLTVVLAVTIGGAGYHIVQYSQDQIERYLQMIMANYALYSASITLSKLAILLFLHCVFGRERWLMIGTWIIGCLVIAYFFLALGFLIFACNPVRGAWNPWIQSKCINSKAFWIGMAAFNIVLDLALLVLPQMTLWKLQLSRQKRLMISMIFVLGGLVCVASVVRIWYLSRIDMADLTCKSISDPPSFTIIETDLSIICACLPMFPALFRSDTQSK